MKKVFVFITLTLVLLMCWVACNGQNEHTYQYSMGLKYTLNSDGESYSVTNIGTCNDSYVIIPEIYNGFPVTSIGEGAFLSYTSLTSVVIPRSVISIEDYAFYGCESLTSVVIPDSVTTIGASAFAWCKKLTSVVISDSMTSIASSAFFGCDELQFNEYENCKYLGSKDNPYLALIKVTTRNLNSYTIHEDTKVIADDAFSKCSGLSAMVIPDGVISVGKSAFNNCTSLTSVVIPDSVTSIGDSAFYNCSALCDVYYTGNMEEWGAITIGSFNYNLIGARIHYNYVPEN